MTTAKPNGAPKAHVKPVIDTAKVEAQAKQIMDAFLVELGSIETPKDFGMKRDGIEHQAREGKASAQATRFRSAFFANAPNVKDDELIMERKKW